MKLFVFPGNIEPEILAAGAVDVPYARTREFGRMVTRCHERLAGLAGAPDGAVLSFTASGTGAAEALLAGWGPRWPRLLVIHGGTFGDRWLKMAGRLGLPVDGFEVPAGHPPDWDRLGTAVREGRPAAVMAVHHETSSGEKLDLARLGELCRQAGTRLVVDAIGSFLADEVSMAEWGIDAALVSSQKGLCLPPGLAFLIIRPPLGPPVPEPSTYYFDPQVHQQSFARGQPPWSPAAQLYVQLDRRLERIDAAGGAAAAVAAVAEKAGCFRQTALEQAGWTGAAFSPSHCLTTFRFDGPVGRLVDDLAGDGFFILPCPDPCQVRIAHLGAATMADHVDLLARMRVLAGRFGLSLRQAAGR